MLLESERAARAEAERMSERQGRIPGHAVARAAHAAQRHPRLGAGAAHAGRSAEETAGQGLETIERNARVQAQLIEDLLDMSRITSGKLRLDMQPLHPLAFIDAAIETVTPAAEAKDIRLERAPRPAAGPISGDPGRLQQVVWNLLSNAIKFTPRGGTVQVRAASGWTRTSRSRVADTGIGIRPEFMPHVFERFRQGDASTTRRYGGLGLGLSIVKNLVELHGGTVGAESAGEGQGATFTVELPLAMRHRGGDRLDRDAARAPPPAPACRARAGRGQGAGGGRRGRRARSDRARPGGLRRQSCSAAASADEALALVEAERPDVLVSDIGMPDVDGYELLRRVRALGPDARRPRPGDRADRVRAHRGSDAGPARRLRRARVEAGRGVRAGGHGGRRRRPRRCPTG